MMENGQMISLMEKESIYTKMGLFTMENGKMINKKDSEKKDGQMGLAMKENIKTGKKEKGDMSIWLRED